MSKIRVGIIYGGKSVEHDVSILSAKNIVGNIDKDLFEITLIGIDKSGQWFNVKSVEKSISSGQPVSVLLNAGGAIFSTSESQFVFDVIFPVLHGTDGEDGAIQGLFQTLDIP